MFSPQTMQYVLCTSIENSPQTNPIIGRIECKAGHGAGRPTQKMVSIISVLFAICLCLCSDNIVLDGCYLCTDR